jgi:hypothetical protein
MAGMARWWPLAGIAFVGLWLGAFAVTDSEVDSQDTDAEILAYFAKSANQHKHFAAFFMILGACLLFVWFVGMLRQRLVKADAGGPLPAIAFGSGLTAMVLWLVADAVFAAPAITVNDTSEFALDPNTFRLLSDLGYGVWFSGTTIAAGVVVATAVVALRTGLLPRWIAWLSFPVALTMLVAFFFIPFLIMLGWILVVSVTLMLRKEGSEGVSASTAA